MFIIGLILGVNIGMILTAIIKVNGKSCLHCGKNNADYCESCYQDLISENARLQYEKDKKNHLDIKKDEQGVLILDNHIPHVD